MAGVRVVFWVYIAVIAAGLVCAIALGLLGH
jgi:hypothetical protein